MVKISLLITANWKSQEKQFKLLQKQKVKFQTVTWKP
jgi:hypothetical protein